LKATIDRIKALEEKLIEASVAKPFDPQAAADAELALNKALDAANVGKVATSSSQITDTALVLLREPLGEAPPPDSPEGIQRARDLALREQKSKVDLLRERMHEVPAEQRAEAYAEHYAELIEYQHQLEAAKTWHDPGITHEFIEAEIERIQGERVGSNASRASVSRSRRHSRPVTAKRSGFRTASSSRARSSSSRPRTRPPATNRRRSRRRC
jgi:hypothetical protein